MSKMSVFLTPLNRFTSLLTTLAILAAGPASIASAGCSRGTGATENEITTTESKITVGPDRVAVAGLSAGAFLAVQLGVAYSNLFAGVASFAGGPYGCAEGTLMGAMTCATQPDAINPTYLVQQTLEAAALGNVDPVSAIARQKIFLYSGELDKTVKPENLEHMHAYFEAFDAKIMTKRLAGAGHGMPTVAFGVPCALTQTPWIANCGYDGAGEALNWIWPGLRAPIMAIDHHLRVFKQKRFGSSRAELADSGFVYVPAACEALGSACRLLVALHGCEQSVPQLGAEFARHSGFNEWAEANAVVVLYPSANPSRANPLGCWDWWGYTGFDYTTKGAAQMSAIVDMIHYLQGRDSGQI